MSVLKLTLKKKWFDMIASGEKKEEYREIKDYWTERLISDTKGSMFRHFNTILFTNGYGKHRPAIEVKCKGIRLGTGKEYWGAMAGEEYFVIQLGEVIRKVNF